MSAAAAPGLSAGGLRRPERSSPLAELAAVVDRPPAQEVSDRQSPSASPLQSQRGEPAPARRDLEWLVRAGGIEANPAGGAIGGLVDCPGREDPHVRLLVCAE